MWVYIAIPCISAFIGWLTNIIALQFLFRPYRPILGIQGALPKYRDKMSDALGVMIKEYILDDKIVTESIKQEDIKQVVVSFMEKIKNPTTSIILKKFADQVATTIETYLKKNIKEILNIIQFDKIVVTRFKTTQFITLEQMLREGLGHGFRFIKMSGLVLGFVIGIVQVLIITIFL